MLTCRVIPPRLLRRHAVAEHDVVGHYFTRLWAGWSWSDRALALLIAAPAAAREWLFGAPDIEGRVGQAPRSAYLGQAERKGVHRLLNPGAFPARANPLKNKHLFGERCAAAGLPVADTFAGGRDALEPWLCRSDAIVVKPNYSSKGKGVMRLSRDPQGGWRRALPAILRALANGAVIQRAVETHPALRAISPGALPTLRIVTVANERDEIEVATTLLRLSRDAATPVDNFNAGNLVAGVDDKGLSRSALVRTNGAIDRLVAHPMTGATIEGFRVPDLGAAHHLAIAAHRLFRGGFTVIGWDIGLGANGPVLIEGNWNPGTDIPQIVAGEGIGASRLGALYRYNLERLPDIAWASARPIEREPR